jgi:serine/threonine-protein kinase
VIPVAPSDTFYPEDPYEPPPDEPSRWWIPVLVGLLVVGLIIGALALTGGGKKVTVPGVVGASRAAAEQTLREKGFSTDVTPQTSDKPRGEVIGQDPAGGTRAKKGSTVNLLVSDGPEQVTIPPLEGEPRNEVRKDLTKLGLKVQEREESSDTVGENRVIESIPGQGERVDKGSEVTLVVSKGPERATVPDVTGSTRDEAQSSLEDAGFTVSVKEVESEDKDPGTVLSQDPAGGTSAKKGSRVTLTVAKEPSQVEVPDVTGENEDDAIAILSKAGFEVRRTTQDVPTEDGDGVVLEQNPAGGKAKKGEKVTITVGRYVPPDTGDGTGDTGSPTETTPAVP